VVNAHSLSNDRAFSTNTATVTISPAALIQGKRIN
jgi:hypothetical protein